MDPTRLTLYSSVGGLLLAALVLGPVFIMALVDHEGTDDPLQQGSMSRPAAQEAFAKGLKNEEAAYLNDRFEMTMEVIGTGDVLMGSAVARADPVTGDYQAIMSMELKAIAEAYGIENPQDDDASANMSQDPDATDPFADLWSDLDEGDWERWEMSVSRIGDVTSFSLGPGAGWSWRDYNSTDDGFTLFSEEEEEQDGAGADVEPPDPSIGGDELARFLDANESVTVHEVEAAEWEGTPAWKVTTTIAEEGIEEEATFHFRQSDMAPLAIDLYLDGADEEGFFSGMYEEDPEALERLKDLELHMKMRFRYGDSIRFEPLEGFTRVGATAETDDERGSDRIVRTITAQHDQVVPLDTLELHLVVEESDDPGEFFPTPEVTQTLGVLRLKDAHEIETDDHRIVYEDNDEDGRLSSGDRFYVETNDENGVWSNETHAVQLLVYDTWAGQYEGAPGPGVVWLLLLALGGATALHRRRHTRRKHVESVK